MITNCDFLSSDIVVALSAFYLQTWRWRNESSSLQAQSCCNSSRPARVEIVAISQARTVKAPPSVVIE